MLFVASASENTTIMSTPLLDAIHARKTARQLSTPGPTREQVEAIIQAGMCAPDHGRLRPWRFIVLEGDARKALGDAMAESLQSRMPEASPARIDAERSKPNRAPTIVVVAAHITLGKIPEVEQLLAVGAATQNMCLAAEALGFGSMWKTGQAAYDCKIKEALGLKNEDQIVAFLYLGALALPGASHELGDSDEEEKVRWMK